MRIPYNQLIKASPHLFLRDVMDLRADGIHSEFIDCVLGGNRVLMLAPRGHGKSKVVQGVIAHYMLNNPDSRIMLISQSYSKSTIFMSGIKRILESNQIVKDVWGDVKGDNWQNDSITLKTRLANHVEPNLIALGAGSSSCTGLHADIIILDDATDFDVVRSQVKNERLELWFKTALLPVLVPGGRIIALGTRYGVNDLYQTLIEMDYDTTVFPAIRDGNALCEWLYPLNDEVRDGVTFTGLETMRKNMGSLLFDLQMMNDTNLLAENNIIKVSWLKYYETTPDDLKDIIIAVDPAIGLKSENDYTAITIWGRSEENDMYLIESINERMSFHTTITTIQGLIDRYKPRTVVIEDVAFQKSIIQELKRLQGYVPIEGFKPTTDKRARLVNVSGYFENGLVYFKRRETELIDQILYFPARYDDLVDSMTLGLNWYKENSSSEGCVIF